MKYFCYCILLSALFVSCRGDKKAGKASQIKSKSQILIDRYKPILQGAWVNKAYMDKLTKTKSPLAAFSISGLTTMLIDTSFIGKDTLKFQAGWGNHEGGDLAMTFRPGRIKGAVKLYYPSSTNEFSADSSLQELGYRITKRDTNLIVYTFDKNRKLVGKTIYFRVLSNFKGHELGYATYLTTNKRLISGAYTLTDTLNHANAVSFTDDGTVSGFSNFKTYFIDDDFTTPPGNNLDGITLFEAGQKNPVSYAFKISNDTLNLYKTSYAKDSIDFIRGKRIYKLVRQHNK